MKGKSKCDMKGDYITTYTGVHFYPLDPDPEDIRITDVAHALSLICRGNGQVKQFYSVGEHCINCAREAKARGLSARLALAALLHDACECYMSDVPRPFKKFLRDYQKLEEQMLSLVYQKYLGSDLTAEEQAQIKKIDDDVLAYDLYYLLGEGSEAALPPLKVPYEYGKITPAKAEEIYQELFAKYSEELADLKNSEIQKNGIR